MNEQINASDNKISSHLCFSVLQSLSPFEIIDNENAWKKY